MKTIVYLRNKAYSVPYSTYCHNHAVISKIEPNLPKKVTSTKLEYYEN